MIAAKANAMITIHGMPSIGEVMDSDTNPDGHAV